MKLTRAILGFAAALTAATLLSGFATAQTRQSDFHLTSSAFADLGTIPIAHTCDGTGTSAPLAWAGEPTGTRSFALIMFDPDARPPRGFVHWVVYDLPAHRHAIPTGKYNATALPGGGVNGRNGAGRFGFIPSCPPPGSPHHYTLTLYALNVARLDVPTGATREQVLEAIQGKVLAETKLVGLYAPTPAAAARRPTR